MKILFVHDKNVRLLETGEPAADGAGSGGVQSYLFNLARRLRSRGHTLGMIRFNPDPTPGSGPYYELKSSSIRPSRPTFETFRNIVDAEAPDVIHLHSVFYAMNPRMIDWARKARPLAYTLHEVSPVCLRNTKVHANGELCNAPVGLGCVGRGCYRLGAKTSILRDIARIVADPLHLAAYRRLPHIMVPSQYLADQLILNGFDEKRIDVVPNPSRYEAADQPETEKQTGRVLFVGRLTEEKGLPQFLDALQLMDSPNWEALIVGDGPLESYARQRVDAGALRGRVQLSGRMDEAQLRREYTAATVVVVPSIAPESFGLAGVESMALGTPVIGFDAGGISEWLDHDVTGILVGRGDVNALAKSIDRLLGDSTLRHRLANNSLESVRKRFSSDVHTDRIVDVYESLIESWGKRS